MRTRKEIDLETGEAKTVAICSWCEQEKELSDFKEIHLGSRILVPKIIMDKLKEILQDNKDRLVYSDKTRKVCKECGQSIMNI